LTAPRTGEEHDVDTAPDAPGSAGDEAAPANGRSPERLQHWVARTSRPLDLLALVFLAAIYGEWLFGEVAPGGWVVRIGNIMSWLVWLAFAVDYVVRLRLSPDRGDFVRTHKLDLLMVLLPFLRMVRVLLILRKSVTRIPTEQIASSLLLLAAGLVSLGALTVWRLEYQAPDATITTIGRAFWWAMVTTTTVGYGDEYPVTAWGRVVAVLVMLVGIGLIGTVSATVASWFVSRRAENDAVENDAVEQAYEQARIADVVELRGRLDAMAAEQTRIRELLEQLTRREGGPA
jgi:voltage-gated potassium channel